MAGVSYCWALWRAGSWVHCKQWMGRGQPSILSTSSVWSESKSKSWAKGWTPHPHLLIAGLKHSAVELAWSPTSMRQVTNQKVTQATSTRSTALPSQAAFSKPNTSHGPHKVRLELTPHHYRAISCQLCQMEHCLQWNLLIWSGIV